MEKIDTSQVFALKELGYAQGCYTIERVRHHQLEMALANPSFFRLMNSNLQFFDEVYIYGVAIL